MTVRTHCVVEQVLLFDCVLARFALFAPGSLPEGRLFLLSALISLGVRCELLNMGTFPCLVAPSFIKASMASIARWSTSCILSD